MGDAPAFSSIPGTKKRTGILLQLQGSSSVQASARMKQSSKCSVFGVQQEKNHNPSSFLLNPEHCRQTLPSAL